MRFPIASIHFDARFASVAMCGDRETPPRQRDLVTGGAAEPTNGLSLPLPRSDTAGDHGLKARTVQVPAGCVSSARSCAFGADELVRYEKRRGESLRPSVSFGDTRRDWHVVGWLKSQRPHLAATLRRLAPCVLQVAASRLSGTTPDVG